MIYGKNQPNVGKCTIHGWYGVVTLPKKWKFIWKFHKIQVSPTESLSDMT